MNTKEKTKRIMKLMGYKYRHDGITGEWWKGQELFYNEWFKDGDCVSVTILDLYDPTNMGLAWCVLNWAAAQTSKVQAPKGGVVVEWDVSWISFLLDDISPNDELFQMPPADAQTLWLDKILELSQQASHL